MATTIRELIISDIKLNLQDISIANGYNSDAGDNVFRARSFGDISNLPAVVIGLPDDVQNVKRHNMDNIVMQLPVWIAAKYTQDDDYETRSENAAILIEQLLGDVRKAMGQRITAAEIQDKSYLQGSPQEMPSAREGEMACVVQTLYQIKYQTVSGDPYTQET